MGTNNYLIRNELIGSQSYSSDSKSYWKTKPLLVCFSLVLLLFIPESLRGLFASKLGAIASKNATNTYETVPEEPKPNSQTGIPPSDIDYSVHVEYILFYFIIHRRQTAFLLFIGNIIFHQVVQDS